MDYKAQRSSHLSSIWLIITIFVFAISYVLMQILYSYAKIEPEYDIAVLTMSYFVPIAWCFWSIILTHFQHLRLGAIFGILVGVNLITNIAFTDIILNGAETFIKVFEPIFSLLPLLSQDFGNEQYNLIVNIIKGIQIFYGVFLIIIHLRVLFRKESSVLNRI